MQMIIGSHADNYNNTYFSELGQIELENAFIELNGFMTDLVVELEARKIVTEDVTVRDVNKGDNKKTTNLKDRIKRVIGNLLKYIKNHDFKVFGYYRIVLGVIVFLYFGITTLLA